MKYEIFEPSDKAKEVFARKDEGRIRLLEGAVRSSKSYTANDLALTEIQALPPCNVLISGQSIASVARNVLAEWKKSIDPNNRGIFRTVRTDNDHFLRIDWRGLRDKKFYLRGAGKEGDANQIQGATFGYWLADELTLNTETFVNMAISRLSLDYSRATWTTNPDHPQHYVKRRFIDDAVLYSKSGGRPEIVRFMFSIDDNPSLSRGYKESIKKLYTGVFYDRYIRGLWVMAEGAIYDFFDVKVHCLRDFPEARYYYAAIDYGTHNPTSFGVFGRNDETMPRVWLEREWYYDSARAGRQLDDAAQAAAFFDFLGNTEVKTVIYDPSALSLILAIKKEGAARQRYMVYKPAVNDVLPGIRTQHRMLVSGEYRVGAGCRQTIDDYGSYVWDKNAAKRGEDAPLKANDHTKDRERYLLHTLFGNEKIDYRSKLR